ncbi:MAG: hypothetical protein LBF89_06425, partial [Bacteroidales bacterium]|nr:hypothetical protein [Bacteroidales bacterium]
RGTQIFILWIINFFRFVRLVFICANPHHLRHLRAFETPPSALENAERPELKIDAVKGLLKWMGKSGKRNTDETVFY